MTRVEWEARCVLCAARGRTVRLESGHVCPACLVRIADDLDAIVQLASLASVEPVSGRGQGRTVPGSRPPINVDGVDPALTLVTECATVLDICEAWERLIREARHMAPYGPVSAQRAQLCGSGSTATLTGCTGFLRASLPWWAESPDQPLEDFAGEIHACRRALARWDPDRDVHQGWRIDCPADFAGGTCGYRLHIADAAEVIQCRRCLTSWSVDRLMLVAADTTDAHMWLDPEAICARMGVDRKTLHRWVREGRIERSHGLYDARPIVLATRRFGT